jgi:YesN/AraC family two-component response regulator
LHGAGTKNIYEDGTENLYGAGAKNIYEDGTENLYEDRAGHFNKESDISKAGGLSITSNAQMEKIISEAEFSSESGNLQFQGNISGTGDVTKMDLSESGNIISSEFIIDTYEKSGMVNSIITYFNEHYQDQISLGQIAKNMYLSAVYISKIFKEEFGDSPINYLIRVRLERARELLESGKYTVKSAARSVGYKDAYHFSRLYKKHMGCPPSTHCKKLKY